MRLLKDGKPNKEIPVINNKVPSTYMKNIVSIRVNKTIK